MDTGNIAVLGEVMLELQPTSAGIYRQGVAGDTFNTGAMLAQLGVATQFFSALGTDPVSATIRAAMEDLRMCPENVLCDPVRLPGLYMIHNDDSGERSFSYWRDTSAAKALFSDAVRFAQMLEKVNNCDAIYWSGITLALMSQQVRDSWFAFLKQYRNSKRKVFFDTNFRARLWQVQNNPQALYSLACQHCDCFLPSLEDLQAIFQLSEYDSAVAWLANQPCPTIVLTAQEKVWFASEGQKDTISLPFLQDAIDTTGAGDAFSGAFMASLMAGLPLVNAVQLAHRFASKVVTVKGALLPSESFSELSDIFNREKP